MKKELCLEIIACLFVAVMVFLAAGYEYDQKKSAPIQEGILYGAYEVTRVIDGDTIICNLGGTETTIRLIGIDTPESVHPNQVLNTDEGKLATEFLKELLGENKVYLEYDIQKIDKYDRTLAYVFLEDKLTMVNKELLKAGWAAVMTVQPNLKYRDDFRILEKAANDAQGIHFDWQ